MVNTIKQCDDREWLISQMAAGRSQREIAAAAGVSTPTIRLRMRKFGIVPRTISEALLIKPSYRVWTDAEREVHAAKMRTVQAGRKLELSESAKLNWRRNRTNLLAGIRAAAADQEHRAKMRNISLALWQDPEYRAKMRAALSGLWDDPEYRARVMLAISRQPKISTQQYCLYQYLDDFCVRYYRESPATVIGYWTFDCLVPKQNAMPRHLLIECQGDYWHTRPEQQARDRRKFSYIHRYFPEYEIMYIWEHEFLARDGVLSRLRYKLGIELLCVDFNFTDIEVRAIDRVIAATFLEQYHYLGKGYGHIVLGAYCIDMLVGCIVFSKPVQNGLNAHVELSRCCIHPVYYKPNFASWLITKAMWYVPRPQLIVAHVDTTADQCSDDCSVYLAAGFRIESRLPIDYWYIGTGNFVMHKKTLVNRARQLYMTEDEFVASHNYRKQYGGERLRYEYMLK